MGKKKVTRTVEEEVPDDPVESLDDELPPDPLAEVLAEFEGVASFQLYRMPGRKYLYTGPVEELGDSLMGWTADTYGGGKYMVQFRESDGAIRRTKRFEVDAAVRPKPQVNADSPRVDGALAQVLDMLKEQRAPSGDPMAIAAEFAKASATQMASTVQMLAPLFERLGGGNRGNSLTELVTALAAIDQLRGDGGGGRSEFGDVLHELQPLIQAIPAAIQRDRVVRGLPPGTLPVAPTPTTSGEGLTMPTGPAGPTGPAPALPPWVVMFKQYAPYLFQMIQQGTDPQEAAAAASALSPRTARWLEAKVVAPDFETWLGQVFEHFPQLGGHKQWVTDFLAEFLPEDVAEGPSS